MPGRDNRIAAAAALLSAILLVLAFPKADFAPLAWIALVPWFASLPGAGPRRGALSGLLFGAAFFGGLLYWVVPALHRHGRLPGPASIAVFLLLVLYLALFPALFGAVIGRIGAGRRLLALVLLPFAWVAFEWMRAHLLSGVPWGLLGVTPYRHPAWIQAAALGGVYAVSLLVAASNALLAGALLGRGRWRAFLIAAAALLLVAVPVAGWRAMPEPGRQGVRVAVVQGNIRQDRKWDAAFRREILERYLALTREALAAGVDLVVWPEAAVPYSLRPAGGAPPEEGADPGRKPLEEAMRGTGAALLVGATEVRTGPGGRSIINSGQFLSAAGEWLPPYAKVHPVPFAEYVPFPRLLFFVQRMAQGGIADFLAGDGPVLHQVRGARFGTAICYEMVFPHEMRRTVEAGAGFLVNITNDGWFDRTAGPYQHFAASVLRAVETRRWVVRAANTGVSGFVDPGGRIVRSIGLDRAAVAVETVAPGAGLTPYLRGGDRFAGACGIMTLAALLWTGLAPRRR